MTDRMRRALADLKARQESGEYTLCPRCGLNTMKPDLFTNALSRLADIEVCDTCGVDEAKLAFMRMTESLYQWAAMKPKRPQGDFRALTGKEAWDRIVDAQSAQMFRLYKQHLNGEEPEEIRFLAFESLPGLDQIWTKPFQMRYACSDGMLIINFEMTEEGPVMEAALADGK